MNGIRLHGIVSNGLNRWAHVLAHALGQSSVLPCSMSMWPAILDVHENFRSADRHGGQDRSNLCSSPYEFTTEQAPCAKPPFCDAMGAKPAEIGRACALYRPQLSVLVVLFVVGMQDAKFHCPATKVSGKKGETASKPRGLSGLHQTASFSTSRANPVWRFGRSTRLAAGGPYNVTRQA